MKKNTSNNIIQIDMETKQIQKIYKIISIILIIIWMLIVFNYSAQNGKESTDTSQGVCQKIIDVISSIRDLNQEEKENLMQKMGSIIRKTAHYSIYLIGGILAVNCCNMYKCDYKKTLKYALIFCIVYAISDEIHQYFVPGRSGRLLDVGIDTLGALTGILIFVGINKKIKDIQTKNIILEDVKNEFK